MTKEELVSLLKLRVGIPEKLQDRRLSHLVDAIIIEIKDELGIEIDLENAKHTEYVLSLADFRYRNPLQPMPPYLKLRRNNLYLEDTP